MRISDLIKLAAGTFLSIPDKHFDADGLQRKDFGSRWLNWENPSSLLTQAHRFSGRFKTILRDSSHSPKLISGFIGMPIDALLALVAKLAAAAALVAEKACIRAAAIISPICSVLFAPADLIPFQCANGDYDVSNRGCDVDNSHSGNDAGEKDVNSFMEGGFLPSTPAPVKTYAYEVAKLVCDLPTWLATIWFIFSWRSIRLSTSAGSSLGRWGSSLAFS